MVRALARVARRVARPFGVQRMEDVATPGARRRAWIDFHIFDHGALRAIWRNLHEVAPGVWRSNQPSPGQLARLKAQGFSFWSEPAHNKFGPAVGETLEASFDGPDGVVINLIQLLTEDPKTVIGHIVQFINGYGRTPTGFTSVVTTAHTVRDMEKALAFYYGPLHMFLFIESVLEGPVTNRALSLPEHARTRSVLVQGHHEYGKIALAAALNYEIPDLVPDAVPPNIGYLAQSFQVPDLAETARGAAAVGAEIWSGPLELDLPGRGRCRAMVVRNPGSGVLQELFQVL